MTYVWISGFQGQSGLPYLCLGGVNVTRSLRFVSNVTPTDPLVVSMAASHFSPHVCFSRGKMPDRPPAWHADPLTTRPQPQ